MDKCLVNVQGKSTAHLLSFLDAIILYIENDGVLLPYAYLHFLLIPLQFNNTHCISLTITKENMRTKETIVHDIKVLLDELVSVTGMGKHTDVKKGSSPKAKETDKYSGCMGGIMYLHDNDFFSSPKGRKEVIDELKREGWHYAPHLVSMNLLSLNRKRVLTRLQGESKKGWVYVVRK